MSGHDITDCPDLTPYAADYRPDHAARGAEALRDDLLGVVKEGIGNHPRSLQKEIGPSEIGHPCNRALAYKFAAVPPAGLQAPKWAAAVGTAVHDHFSDWLHQANQRAFRWLFDTRVWVGDLYPGRPITGHMDAFDTWTGTVIDLKCPSSSVLDKARRAPDNGPQYDAQLDLYGTGAVNAGLPVRHVGILRLPRNGQLADADWKVRPHDPDRGRRALQRAGAIAQLADTLGAQATTMQPATEHYCGTCPWFRPGSTDLTTGCPGAASFLEAREKRVTTPPNNLLDLAGPNAVTTPAQPVAPRDPATPPDALLALAGAQTPTATGPRAH